MPSLPQPSDLSQTETKNETQDEIITLPVSTVHTISQSWSNETKEIVDTLPRPWTRGLLYILVLFTTIILPWAFFAKIEQTGTARGRLEPKEKTISLDSSINCTVTNIAVSEGDEVQAGQIIAECNANLVRNKLNQLQQQLVARIEQLRQLKTQEQQLTLALATQKQQNYSHELEKQNQIQQAQKTLDSLINSYYLEQTEKQQHINQARNTLEITKADYELAQAQLKQAQVNVSRYQKLHEEDAISEEELNKVALEAKGKEKAVEKTRLEIEKAKAYLKEKINSYDKLNEEMTSKIEQAKLDLEKIKNSYDSLIYANKKSLLETEQEQNKIKTEITTINSAIEDIKSEQDALEIELTQHIFYSPIQGLVFSLPVTKPGEVIQSGDLVAKIAPSNSELILKAELPASESGFLKEELPVKIKFDAYPFQDYGIVEGMVSWVSPTSKIIEDSQGSVKVYEVEITIPHPYIYDGKESIDLAPGQSATAELVVRQRRVIDLILEPFKKLQKAGLEM